MIDKPIDSLPNLGPATRRRLEEVGIATEAELLRLGAVEAYRRLKFRDPKRVSLNALYALEAAIRNTHWLHLPKEVKAALKVEAGAIDEALRRAVASRGDAR